MIMIFCPYWPDCTAINFRFETSVVIQLENLLHIPEFFRCEQGTKVTGLEGLLIMLRRLCYPNRWCDLVPLFGLSESELSAVFNLVGLL